MTRKLREARRENLIQTLSPVTMHPCSAFQRVILSFNTLPESELPEQKMLEPQSGAQAETGEWAYSRFPEIAPDMFPEPILRRLSVPNEQKKTGQEEPGKALRNKARRQARISGRHETRPRGGGENRRKLQHRETAPGRSGTTAPFRTEAR